MGFCIPQVQVEKSDELIDTVTYCNKYRTLGRYVCMCNGGYVLCLNAKVLTYVPTYIMYIVC